MRAAKISKGMDHYLALLLLVVFGWTSGSGEFFRMCSLRDRGVRRASWAMLPRKRSVLGFCG